MTDRESIIKKCQECIDSGEPPWEYSFYYKVIELLKEQSQLIGVKDKLPGIDKDVLFLYESKTSDKTGYIVISLKDFFSEQWQYFRENNVITHWMPLPEPPEEVKRND